MQKLSMKIKSKISFYLPLFKFKPMYLQNLFLINNIYNLQTDLKTRNGEKLSLNLIFTDNFCQNAKILIKQNSILRIYSKPTEFTQN